ncbi:MFS transporter [Burkholderia sp. Nafp2/4-1b]|uniref:MFS transporter n=1 Tax=Burkholderia sp. Nafp2/4-1b TaxID=2116686 RepID=UPI000EF894B6|nr:MFS transporter [Burkholderia sp. Nafp2/4-1b]RKU05384.1 MFS transporter [Burkholderia sp. Nafp2/4-1b]
MQSTIAVPDAVPSDRADRVFRKIMWRVMPLVFLGYMCAFLDRINIGYAQLQMKDALGFSDSVYGLGAGIFFVSYLLCEVPSNMLFERLGARRTFLRIMLLWGLTSAATMFVRTPLQFYVMRFLLGVFEAGFFPGVILYLGYWFTPEWRGRATSAFLFALPVAGVVGGPLSGTIIRGMNGIGGLAGWQWCFLLEGLPTVFVGLLCYRFLSDTPEAARWLSADEKRVVAAALPPRNAGRHGGWPAIRDALSDVRVYSLGLVYFAIACGSYAFTFWLPMLIKGLGVNDPATIGWYALPPYAAGAIGTWAVAARSDGRHERRTYIVASMLIAAVALAATTLASHSLVVSLALLCATNFFLMGAGVVFWAVPSAVLPAQSAAAGIALVSSIGILGGFFSPALIGLTRDLTGSLSGGLQLMSVILVVGAGIARVAIKRGIAHDVR